MIQTVRHRYEAKLDEVAENLRGEGYVVHRGADVGESEIDLVAEKDGRRVAVEIKDSDELKAGAGALVRLKNLAVARGFHDFRVVVVNPPRRKTISVPRLDAILADASTRHPPAELTTLADHVVVNRIHGVDVDSLAMDAGDVHVIGSAVAAVELSYEGSEGATPLKLTAEFPIRFDLRLASDLTLRQIISLHADTQSFTGP